MHEHKIVFKRQKISPACERRGKTHIATTLRRSDAGNRARDDFLSRPVRVARPCAVGIQTSGDERRDALVRWQRRGGVARWQRRAQILVGDVVGAVYPLRDIAKRERAAAVSG